MAVSISGIQISAGTTVAIPAHGASDLILIYGYASAGGLPPAPSVPAAGGTVPTWISMFSDTASDGVSNTSHRLVRAVATASNHTSGIFTNATKLAAVVMRGQAASPIGGSASKGGNAGTDGGSVAAAITPSKTDGTSLQIYFHGTGDGSNQGIMSSSVPAGYTIQQLSTGTAAQGSISVDTKNVTTTDGSWLHASDLSWCRSASVEILAGPTSNFFPFF